MSRDNVALPWFGIISAVKMCLMVGSGSFATWLGFPISGDFKVHSTFYIITSFFFVDYKKIY